MTDRQEDIVTKTTPTKLCLCPDDCTCRKPWRQTLCGCKAHKA